MQPFRSWSLARVLLLCAGWVVLSFAVCALWIFSQLVVTSNMSSGSGGIGAVSVGVSTFILAIPVVPPIALMLAWSVVRIRR